MKSLKDEIREMVADRPETGEIWFSEYWGDGDGWSVNDRWKVSYSSREELVGLVESRTLVMRENYDFDIDIAPGDCNDLVVDGWAPVVEFVDEPKPKFNPSAPIGIVESAGGEDEMMLGNYESGIPAHRYGEDN